MNRTEHNKYDHFLRLYTEKEGSPHGFVCSLVHPLEDAREAQKPIESL